MSFQKLTFLALFLSLSFFLSFSANADLMCDANLSDIDEAGMERITSIQVYIKANKVKLELQDGVGSFILRSDLQVLLSLFPGELAYVETSYAQFYTLPFGRTPLSISPGSGSPVVELIATGETTTINSLLCKKYIINEISSFRCLQYVIYTTEDLVFDETPASFFQTQGTLLYQPFEEMKKIPGLPVSIQMTETVDTGSNTKIFEFFAFREAVIDDAVFAVPGDYTLKNDSGE